MSEATERFDCWAIVEAMGFKKYAGHVTTQELAGSSFICVDVPETSIPAFAKLIGAGSIYMITPVDEATARKAAAVLARGESPLPVYIPTEPKQLPPSISERRGREYLDDDGDPDWDDDHDEVAEQLQQDAIDEAIMAEGDAAQAAEQAANQ